MCRSRCRLPRPPSNARLALVPHVPLTTTAPPRHCTTAVHPSRTFRFNDDGCPYRYGVLGARPSLVLLRVPPHHAALQPRNHPSQVSRYRDTDVLNVSPSLNPLQDCLMGDCILCTLYGYLHHGPSPIYKTPLPTTPVTSHSTLQLEILFRVSL